MTQATPAPGETGMGDFEEIQQFYARHMQALDAGDADSWARTLTDGVVFSQNIRPAPRRGRDIVTSRMKETCGDLAARGVTRRHWLGMLDVQPRDERTVDARCYVLVIETPAGGKAAIRASTVCSDVLVHIDGEWLLSSREILHDGTP